MAKLIGSHVTESKAPDKIAYPLPKSVQETIPGKVMYENGILDLGNKLWSKTYKFDDINFITEGYSQQDRIFNNFCKILESVSVFRMQITIVNHPITDEEIKSSVYIKYYEDGYDHIRDMYNAIIQKKIKDVNEGLIQEKYITLTIYGNNYQDANAKFSRQETELKIAFSKIISEHAGTTLYPLNGDERVRLLYDFYHMYDKNKLIPDSIVTMKDNGRYWKDEVACDRIKFKESGFETDTCVGAAYAMKTRYPVEGVQIPEISNISVPSMLTVSIKPLETTKVEKELSNKLGLMQMKDYENEKKAARQGSSYSGSFARNNKINDLLDVMESHKLRHDKFFLTSVTAVLIADRPEKLKKASGDFIGAAKTSQCEFRPLKIRQLECMNSALPYGVDYTEGPRFCNTWTVGSFIPFEAINLQDEGGNFYGINQSNQKVIIGNRSLNKNGNGLVLGSPGSGKSFITKIEMGSVYLNQPETYIVIVDPQGEYTRIAKQYGGATVSFSEEAGMHINPLDIDFGRCEHEYTWYKPAIQEKKSLILSILETTLARSNECLSSEQRSIVSQVVESMYIDNFNMRKRLFAPEENRAERYSTPDWMKDDDSFVSVTSTQELTSEEIMWNNSPIFSDFNKILKLRDDAAAEPLKNLLDTFISGELSYFNNRTNVNISSRFLTYDLSAVDAQLKPLAMLVMLAKITGQIESNSKSGHPTYLYIDEFHEILSSDDATDFVISIWKKVRKLGGICTAMTQNVSDLCESSGGSRKETIFSNSEFILLLGQAESDLDMLKRKLPDITDDQFQFALNSAPGKGLLRFRPGLVVPFDMTIDKDTDLYRLYNTNFFENSGLR